MDRQAWVAIILCLLVLAAWQVYVAKYAPPVPAKVLASPRPSVGRDSVEPEATAGSAVAANSPSPGAAPGSTESRPTEGAAPPNEATPTPAPFVEQTTTL